MPAYRTAAAPLVLDAHLPGGVIEGQQVPYALIPDFAREHLGDDLEFRQPISEIGEMVASAGRRGEATVKLGVPLAAGVVALMNDELQKDRPGQTIERIYWDVSLIPLTRILDGVRTRLVTLIAEMRAGNTGGCQHPVTRGRRAGSRHCHPRQRATGSSSGRTRPAHRKPARAEPAVWPSGSG